MDETKHSDDQSDEQIDQIKVKEILDDYVIHLKRGRKNREGFEKAWNGYFDFYLSAKYLKRAILKMEDVTFHLFLLKNLNDYDPSWKMPSMRMLKKRLGVGQGKIETIIERLEAARLLVKVSGIQQGDRGENVGNEYKLSDPIQYQDEFLAVAAAGIFPEPLKDEWQQLVSDPVPDLGTGGYTQNGYTPVPDLGAHKQTLGKQTTTDVVKILQNEKIHQKLINQVVKKYSRDEILQIIDWRDFLRVVKPEQCDSPQGWLAAALRDGYVEPAGYTKDWREQIEAEKKGVQEALIVAKEKMEQGDDKQSQKAKKTRQKCLEVLRDEYQTSQREDDLWKLITSQILNRLKTSERNLVEPLFSESALLGVSDDQATIIVLDDVVRTQIETKFSIHIPRMLAQEYEGAVTPIFITYPQK